MRSAPHFSESIRRNPRCVCTVCVTPPRPTHCQTTLLLYSKTSGKPLIALSSRSSTLLRVARPSSQLTRWTRCCEEERWRGKGRRRWSAELLSVGPCCVTRPNPTHYNWKYLDPTRSDPIQLTMELIQFSSDVFCTQNLSVSGTCQIGRKIKFSCLMQPNLI